MEIFSCHSDIGSVLIGNKDWTFAIPNNWGDGITYIHVFDSDETFMKYRKTYKRNHEFISSVQGTFNVFDYDCAFHHMEDSDVLTTLSGRYGVYVYKNNVAFVKWE